MEGAMRADLWNKSVPRVEMDQRVRDARLRLHRMERLLVPQAAVTSSWFKRVLWLFGFGKNGGRVQGRRIRGPLSNRRFSPITRVPQGWAEAHGSFCRALGLPPLQPSLA
jgi:hypothetical protein